MEIYNNLEKKILTQIIDIGNLADPQAIKGIELAGELIRRGELVGFPTETVYGLGANAFDPAAVAGIFAAKGRPADNPLISHIAEQAMLEELVYPTPLALLLAKHFWPGPLTLVLPKRSILPDIVTAGLATAGVRFPRHQGALALIRAARRPIAAPSANTSGRPSPTLATHVFEDMQGKIPLILDGGALDIGLESTVVDACGEYPIILRPGKITAEQLAALCGKVGYPEQGATKRPAAPGMKYTHYAPQGKVQLAADAAEINFLRHQILSAGAAEPLLILFADTAAAFVGTNTFIIAQRGDLESYARNIFAAFRLADAKNVANIIVEKVDNRGLGAAIMNRLRKSAGI